MLVLQPTQSVQIVPVETAFSMAMREVREGAIFTSLQKPAEHDDRILVLGRNKETGRVVFSIPSDELSIVRQPGEFHWDNVKQRFIDEDGEPCVYIGHYVGVLLDDDQGKRAAVLYRTLSRYKGPDLNLTVQELEQIFKDEKNVLMVFSALAADETRGLVARARDCVEFALSQRGVPFTPRETLLVLAAFSFIANAKEAEMAGALSVEGVRAKEQLRA